MTQKKFFLFLVIGLLTLTYFSLIPVNSFASHSFAQQTGDEYVWTVQTSDATFTFMSDTFRHQGDQLKITIDMANQTIVNTVLSDTVYGSIFNRTPASEAWTLFEPTYRIAYYNQIVGYGFPNVPFFIPRNETAVNASMELFLHYIQGYEHYKWLSGSQGYDGIAIGYDGSINGDFGEKKEEWTYNKDGVLQTLKAYKGTGPGWFLYYHLELETNIPGFLSAPLVLILAVFVVIYLLLNRKKEIFLL